MSDYENNILRVFLAQTESSIIQENVWGGDWFPDIQEVGFESLINIRPRQGNCSLELQSPDLRERFEAIVRRLLEVEA